MWQTIAGVIQIIFLVMKNKFERDEELRKKKEALYVEAKDVLKTRDTSRVNDLLTRMRE